LGPDLVGDFVLAHLAAEGHRHRFIPRKPGTRTGLAIVGVEPPTASRWSSTATTQRTSGWMWTM
jgi:sugar/nucleoside kinase (ribokinase family)